MFALLSLLFSFGLLQFSRTQGLLLLLSVDDTATTYFNTTFQVSTSIGTPLVTCRILCPGGLSSSVSHQMTSSSAAVPVPVPAYTGNGNCEASVEALGYLSSTLELLVLSYTQCQVSAPSSALYFSVDSAATFAASYPLSGPLGFMNISSYQVLTGFYDLLYNPFQGALTTDYANLKFFETFCVNEYHVDISLSDDGQYSLRSLDDCDKYAVGNSFQPFEPFFRLYGDQAQGTYNFTTFFVQGAPVQAQGSVEANTVTICLAANYIEAQTTSSNFAPESTLSFTASLGLAQSMTASGVANLTCGLESTETTLILSNTDATFTIDTPSATNGQICELYIRNDPENEAYAAPIKLFLTAVETVTSTEITSTITEIASTSAITSQTATSTDVVTTTTVPTTTTSLILSASPATQTAGGFVAYSVFFDPPSTATVTISLTCSVSGAQSFSTQTSTNTQNFQLNGDLVGSCAMIASGAGLTSNSVPITVLQQLYVASNLIGWSGGQSVKVNITSLSLIATEIPCAITCSTSRTSGSVTGSRLSPFALSSILNGVACLLSSSYSDQYYLNLQPIYVNIAMSPGIITSVIESINPAAFIGAASGTGISQVALEKRL